MYKRRVLRRRKQDVCGDLRLWRSLCLGRAEGVFKKDHEVVKIWREPKSQCDEAISISISLCEAEEVLYFFVLALLPRSSPEQPRESKASVKAHLRTYGCSSSVHDDVVYTAARRTRHLDFADKGQPFAPRRMFFQALTSKRL